MDDEAPICSAKGCRAAARSALVWNNPALHTADREKTWVACDAHLTSLSQFLDLRGFLRRVDPLRSTCADCGATFPPEQVGCPVCAGVRTGSCGSRD